MKKNLLFVLALMLLSCNELEKTSNVSKYNSKEIIANFTELIENDVNDDNIKGSASLVVLKGDKILASKVFGFIDNEKGDLANSNTIYRIGSITKSFTGFLLLKLHQDNVIDLNDPIEKYLPEIKGLVDYNKHKPITFKQLASHTTGLDRESRHRDANFGPVKEWEQKVIAAIPETRFRNEPGERFRYSNIGYAILGLALSKATKKPYIELVQENILQPLKMNRTYFEIPENIKSNLAKGMAGGPTAELNYRLPLDEHKGRGYRVPNGGLYSTPNDMAKFMKACLGYSKILVAESVQLLQTTQTPTTRLRSNYSFGFDLYKDSIIYTVGHGGSTPGYSAHFEFEKNSEYGVIIMRNYNFGNTNLDLRSNALLRKLKQTE